MNTSISNNGNVETPPEPPHRRESGAEAPVHQTGTSTAAPGRAQMQHEPAKRGGFGHFLVVIVAGVAIAGVVLWHRSKASVELAATTKSLATQTVTTILPKTGPSETEIVLPGNLTAYSEAPIYARTNGYIKAWYTDIGAKVTAGQLMAEIEAPDVDAQLLQANANLAQARANLEIAKLNFERSKTLLSTKVISQQEFDQNRTNLDAQEAAVKAGEANVQNLKVQQGFQKITAPFTGVVTRRNTDVGALINSGNAGNNAQELFHVARTDILRVFIQVPEVYSSMVTVDSSAWLDLAEAPGVKFHGKVAHVAGALDMATRTLLTEVQVDNADGRLFPGAYANVHLELPIKNAPVVIPVNTVLFRSQGTQVGVVDDSGTVHLKNVTVGHDFGTSFEITKGISASDRLIVNPSDSLMDGAKVEVARNSSPDDQKK